jgi:hypothetical protein
VGTGNSAAASCLQLPAWYTRKEENMEFKAWALGFFKHGIMRIREMS